MNNKVSHSLNRAVIFGCIILFAISAYFILSGSGKSISVYYLFFYWTYLAGVFFLAGWITQRLINFVSRDVIKDIDPLQSLILGAAFVTTAAILFNFVLPISGALHTTAILSLCILCLFDHKKIYEYCTGKLNYVGVVYQSCSTTHILLAAPFLAAFIMTVLRVMHLSIGGPTESDTLFYHAQIVRWIKEYPIVPGLGNLDSRLAYNSSFHILASLFDIGAFQNKSFHGLNGFFFLVLQAMLLIRAWILCCGTIRISNIFAVFFILLEPFLITETFFAKINSLSTDFITLVMTGCIIWFFIQHLEDENHPAKRQVIIGLVLTAFAVTVKLVSVPLLLILIFVLIRHMRASRIREVIQVHIRDHLFIYLLGFTIFVPWMIRSIILSGYIVFPVYQIDVFNPDWKVPKASVIDEVRWIESWARIPRLHPDQVLDRGILHWFNRWDKQSVIPLGVIFGIHSAILLFFFSSYKKILLKTWPIYMTLAAALAYWFFSAPDLRFGYGIIYSSSIFLVSIILIRPLQAMFENRTGLRLMTSVISICLLLTVLGKSPNHLSYLSEELIAMPVLPTKEYIAKSGLKMRIPIQGDLVGNSELPSTPHPRDNIVVRRNGLEGGFRTLPK